MSKSRPTRRAAMTQRRAFTLIEVLVVVAIIALLISILLPSLAAAREAARSAACLSQLRQMAIAAQSYTNTYASSYPIYQYTGPKTTSGSGVKKIVYEWDYTYLQDLTTSQTVIRPGLLWQGMSVKEIQQCPTFKGDSNADGDPFTGYDYNTSYVGWYSKADKVGPARQDQIRRPSRCAIFGDGGMLGGGANKFMRAPIEGARDGTGILTVRASGVQDYRHLKKTNASFADGHAESRIQRFTDINPSVRDLIPSNCGFLSSGNEMYSLDGKSPMPPEIASN